MTIKSSSPPNDEHAMPAASLSTAVVEQGDTYPSTTTTTAEPHHHQKEETHSSMPEIAVHTAAPIGQQPPPANAASTTNSTNVMSTGGVTITPISYGDDPHTPAYLKAQVPVPQPNRIHILVNTTDKWVLQRKWWTNAKLLIFTVIWCVITVVMNVLDFMEDNATIGQIIFGVLFPVIGIFCISLVVIEVCNSTYLTITAQEQQSLHVEHKPFSLCRNRVIDIATIQETICKRNSGRNYYDDDEWTPTFDVLYRDANSVEHVIVSGLPTAEQALFIDQELEKRLGLSTTRSA